MKHKGNPIHLYFSIGLLFDIQDRYDTLTAAMEAAQANTKEGVETLLHITNLMMQEYDRLMVYLHTPAVTPQTPIDHSDHLFTPRQINALRKEVISVIEACVLPPENDEEEIDLVLQELKKKDKKNPSGGRTY